MADPKPTQTLILWALLAQGGAGPQAAVKPAVKPTDRQALAKAGLLTVEKRGRGYWLEVTDSGWAWAGDNLGAELPSGRNATKAGTEILHAWLVRLQAFMRAKGVGLADILAPGPGDEEQPKLPPPTQPDYAELRERIRAAYFELTDSRTGGVTLSRIRKKLPGIDRPALDDALRRMHGESGSTLMNLDNPREIEAEGDAAIDFKGVPMHVLWITR